MAGNENSGGWNRGMKKRYCVHGHDTSKVGRNPHNGTCRECANAARRKGGMSKGEEVMLLMEREIHYLRSDNSELQERVKNQWGLLDGYEALVQLRRRTIKKLSDVIGEQRARIEELEAENAESRERLEASQRAVRSLESGLNAVGYKIWAWPKINDSVDDLNLALHKQKKGDK